MTKKNFFNLVLSVFSIIFTLLIFFGCDNGTTNTAVENSSKSPFEGKWVKKDGGSIEFIGSIFIITGGDIIINGGERAHGIFTYNNNYIMFDRGRSTTNGETTEKYEFRNNGKELYLTGVPELSITVRDMDSSLRVYSKTAGSSFSPNSYKPVIPEGWIAENGIVPLINTDGKNIGNMEGIKYIAKTENTCYDADGNDGKGCYVYLLSTSFDKAYNTLFQMEKNETDVFKGFCFAADGIIYYEDVWPSLAGKEINSVLESNEYFVYISYYIDCHGYFTASLIEAFYDGCHRTTFWYDLPRS